MGDKPEPMPVQPLSEGPTSVAASVASSKLPTGVHVVEDAVTGDVTLTTDDGEIRWLAEDKKWEVAWKWSSEKEPQGQVGPNISEYSRSKLTSDQEESFCREVDSWVEKGWLIPHDADVHGEPAAVLPLLAVVQEHKATTPVRPCLDYRALNSLLVSSPGAESPVCQEKLRKWRACGCPDDYELLDIRKAYLQVHISPQLMRFQTVRWRGKTYVMSRMGFGLRIAPKFMDLIVKYPTRQFPGVDNYIDDLLVPKPQSVAVKEQLQLYSLPTKPAERFRYDTCVGPPTESL